MEFQVGKHWQINTKISGQDDKHQGSGRKELSKQDVSHGVWPSEREPARKALTASQGSGGKPREVSLQLKDNSSQITVKSY